MNENKGICICEDTAADSLDRRPMSTEKQMKAPITYDEITQEKHPIQVTKDDATSSRTFEGEGRGLPWSNGTGLTLFPKYKAKKCEDVEWLRRAYDLMLHADSPLSGFRKLLETIINFEIEEYDQESDKDKVKALRQFIHSTANELSLVHANANSVTSKTSGVGTVQQEVENEQNNLKPLELGVVVRHDEQQILNGICRASRTVELETANIEIIVSRYGIQIGSKVLPVGGYYIVYDLEKRLGITHEYIIPGNLEGDAKRKKHFKYHPDVSNIYSPSREDFTKHGCLSGHLAASRNYQHSQEQRDATMYLPNIVPQKTQGKIWSHIEDYVCDLLGRYTALYVTTGSLMLPDTVTSTKVEYQLSGQLAVPTHLFKIVIAEMENKPMGIIVFIEPNGLDRWNKVGQSSQDKLQLIEERVGYKFAPKIDTDELEDLTGDYEQVVLEKKTQKKKAKKTI